MSFYLVLVTTSAALIYFIYQWAKLADRIDKHKQQQYDRIKNHMIRQAKLHWHFKDSK